MDQGHPNKEILEALQAMVNVLMSGEATYQEFQRRMQIATKVADFIKEARIVKPSDDKSS